MSVDTDYFPKAAAGGPFEVGPYKTWFGQTGTVALDASGFLKTNLIENTGPAPIDVVLPPANQVPGGTVTANALGLINIGGPIHLRDNAGNLLARFAGTDPATIGPAPFEIGCKLDLLNAASAAGKWAPRRYAGTVFSPRVAAVDKQTAASWTPTSPSANYSFENLRTLGLGWNRGAVVTLDATGERKLLVWKDAGGTRCRVQKVNLATKAITYGGILTLSSYAAVYGPYYGVVYNATGGKEYVLLGLFTAVTTRPKMIAVEVNDTTCVAGAAVAVSGTDNAGNTLANDWSEGAMAFCALSTTKILVFYADYQTSGTVHRRGSWFHVTVSGTPPLTLSLSTPQNFGNTVTTTGTYDGLAPLFLVPGVADRVFQCCSGMLASATTEALIINTSGADPAVAYEAPAFTLPCGVPNPVGSQAWYQNWRFWFDTVDGWIYCIHKQRAQELWRFKATSASFTNIEFVREVPPMWHPKIGGGMSVNGALVAWGAELGLAYNANNAIAVKFDIAKGGRYLGFPTTDGTYGAAPLAMFNKSFQLSASQMLANESIDASKNQAEPWAGRRMIDVPHHGNYAIGNSRLIFGWTLAGTEGRFVVGHYLLLDGVSGDPGQNADVLTAVYELPEW